MSDPNSALAHDKPEHDLQDHLPIERAQRDHNGIPWMVNKNGRQHSTHYVALLPITLVNTSHTIIFQTLDSGAQTLCALSLLIVLLFFKVDILPKDGATNGHAIGTNGTTIPLPGGGEEEVMVPITITGPRPLALEAQGMLNEIIAFQTAHLTQKGLRHSGSHPTFRSYLSQPLN
ncbi:hypothetical protein CY34DRAFT_646490 [Suillus luteus UH-Slu-Lm8-n1]|uniref:Uncharacterized protein n=1 Tax=Suillus luteus UH-Slu-Lm8-n1 TaxID=930992 RepID=A0A0C9ZA56_9AGAM|nr:hypothetical protein CY34DRAFT_646490 [Suillus luteus UH-Slu-Lm8-n1]